MKIKLGILGLVGVILVMSCGKSLDAVKPSIEYVNPKEGETVTMGTDSFHFRVLIVDDVEVKKVMVNLTSAFSSNSIFSKTYIGTGARVICQDSFLPKGISTMTPMTLTIVAQDNQNEATSSVNFNVTP